jgi:hypothetical protein
MTLHWIAERLKTGDSGLAGEQTAIRHFNGDAARAGNRHGLRSAKSTPSRPVRWSDHRRLRTLLAGLAEPFRLKAGTRRSSG